MADEFRRSLLRALRDVRRYAAVPTDADRTCACAGLDCCSLPIALEKQTLEIVFPEEHEALGAELKPRVEGTEA